MAEAKNPPGTLLVTHHSASLGGAEIFLLRLLRAARDEGWDTRLLLGADGPLRPALAEIATQSAVAKLAYPGKIFSWPRRPNARRALAALMLDAPRPWVAWSGDFLSLWSVQSWARPNGARLVSLWQGEYDFSDDSCWRKWQYYGARHADVLVAYEPVAEHLRALSGGPREKLRALNPPLEPERFDPANCNRAALRQNFGWPEQPRIALCVGRIGERKGQLWLAEKFLADRALRQNWRLVLAGPAEDAERTTLAALTAQSNGQLVWLGPRHDVPELLDAADLVIFPGVFSESFGMAAAEALLMGAPLLAFGVGALPWVLGANHPGLVPATRRDALLERWRALDDAALAGLRGFGKAAARERFAAARWRARLREILRPD